MRITGKLITIVATVLAFTTSGFSQETPTKETIVATVNGKDITLGHVVSLASRLPDQFLNIEDKDLYAGIVDQLIQQQLLSDLITEETVELKLARDNEQRAFLAAEAIDRISAEAVTQDAINEQYETVYKNAEPIPEYHASHILLDTEVEATTVVKLLASNFDFVETAKKMSTGPTGPQGGDLGWAGLGRLVPEFEAVMVTLEVDQISAPVKTQFGWHVIKLNGKRNQPIPDLSAVLDEIEEGLKAAALEKRISQLETSGNIVRKEQEIDPSFVKKFEILKD